MERTNQLYAVTALFDTPNKIIAAAKAVSGAGYTKFDVNTPYPVHGMDDAMGLKPSKLGFVTLAFGLTGTTVALLLMYWAQSVEYPMVIGGKPFFALPAFIPITFELTVLLATLSTVFGMLSVFFKLPDNQHPLHDTEYMKSVSVDKFGVVIEAVDPLFNEAKAKELFASLGAISVINVNYPVKEKFTLFDPKFFGFLAGTAVFVSIITYVTLNWVVYRMVPFTWMSVQPKVTAQSHSTFFADGFGMRTPVSGTVARGQMPYEYNDAAQPAVPVTNPYPVNDEMITLGKRKFLTYCSPCHGNYAEGDSRLRGQFPAPPSLHSQKARDWADGNIYHIIMKGQNTMPSYAAQLTDKERWAVVTYVRVLQKAKNASSDDVKAYQKESANVTK